MLGAALLGAAAQAHQNAQANKQVYQYNEAVIEQQRAGANILNAYADQLKKQ